ncbi:MAG TPA: N-acetylmuramoyl-L-alanine amidase [Archangium sp.]|jgi:N-acetylmuramoyl-L-alanine amidase|uniref:N-acetylmuramoyl-L-alanine amidase n=1 Tax=Archangium sp. TaxID=1872627 RepID=UPI002ED8712D
MSQPDRNDLSIIPMASPNFDCRRYRKVVAIVLHGTGSNDGLEQLTRLRNPASRASVHYLVERDGQIYQLVADKDRAWHAGPCRLHGRVIDMDEHSIGIAVVGDGREDPAYTRAQYDSLRDLVSMLMEEYGTIPPRNVVRHRDVAVGRGDGPSTGFDFDLVIHEVVERRQTKAEAPNDLTASEQAASQAGMELPPGAS